MKCIFNHKWSKWSFLKTLNNKRGKPSKLVRSCSRCNTIQEKLTFVDNAKKNSLITI